MSVPIIATPLVAIYFYLCRQPWDWNTADEVLAEASTIWSMVATICFWLTDWMSTSKSCSPDRAVVERKFIQPRYLAANIPSV